MSILKTYSFREAEELISYIYGAQRIRVDSYIYPVGIAAIAANAQGNAQLKILSNADFLLTRISAAFDTSAVTPLVTASLQIVDSASNERFFSDFCPYAIAAPFPAEAGGQIRSLPFPRWISQNSTLDILVNGGASGAIVHTLNFEGLIIRPYSQ